MTSLHIRQMEQAIDKSGHCYYPQLQVRWRALKWYENTYTWYKELQWVILYKSLIEEQVVLVAGTTSVTTHVDGVQAGLAIFVIEPSPQTKEFGKSIPGNLSERQA